MFEALKHRNFRLFFIGQFISLVGTWMQSTAAAWLVYRLTKDPMMLGLVSLLGQLPVFIFGFYAGFAVDHSPHLVLVKRTQFLAMLQAVVMATLSLTGTIAVWNVMALALILGTINAFDMPARQVLIGELVPIDFRHNAIALNSTIVNGSRILGPALAGLFISQFGESGCFAVNALSFIPVLLALNAMRDVRQPSLSIGANDAWQEIWEGTAYAFRHPKIRLILLVLAIFGLAGLPIFTLLPIYAEDVLSHGAWGLGVLSASSGFGATLGALDLARRRKVAGVGRKITQACWFIAAALVGMAMSRSFFLSCAMMATVGWGAIRMLAGINTSLQHLSDDQHRGRVMSFYAMTFVGLSPIGSFLVGSAASRSNTTATTLAMAGAMIGLALLCRRRLHAL